MRVKSVFLSLVVVVSFVGFVSVGITHAALDFVDWSGTWFSVKVSESGLAGTVVPPGGNVVNNNEGNTTTYLLVNSWDFDTATYDVVYCTFDGSVWVRHTGLEWPVFGGEPDDFLTFFIFSYEESQANLQSYWIPLNVTGKEKSNTVGQINSASFKNYGGVFTEERPTQRGMGSVKFTGSFIKADQVTNKVPAGCRVQQ